MAEYCKGIIYASKVRQKSLSELSIGDFKIDCFINWVCVLFQLFYSVTVDSFWQFRINSFLGCALVLRREEEAARYPVSTWHGWLPRDEVFTCTLCTHVQWCGPMPHGILLVSPKNSSVTDIYCAWLGPGSQAAPGMVTQWTRGTALGEAEAHTPSLHPPVIRSGVRHNRR